MIITKGGSITKFEKIGKIIQKSSPKGKPPPPRLPKWNDFILQYVNYMFKMII